ncbi:hypothetical protein [Streptomyces adelaidensis]|uniref:hypothetical protein n=1 Tax=Streptomyces adelaidensis TaxID=2796465 RepID=UPI0019087F46|nr:hypothetical protein [Streptomyces adelaidensis]
MRAIRVASAVLLGVTALSFTAPAAQAAPAGDITSFGFGVLPSTVAAGGQVTLRVDSCNDKATVSSGVFDTVTIPKGQSSATATVDWDAKPGAVHEVTFQCGNESGQTDLTIATGRPAHQPTRGARAGAGGTVAGLDLQEIGLGAVLIAGSLGAAWHWSRRRPEDGGHS